jgi:hypothetical protein
MRAIPLLTTALLALALCASPARALLDDAAAPVPVLGGGRILLPGPPRLGFGGLAADPSTIGNFRGVVALAYLRGTVRDSTGRQFVMVNDVRIFRGDYVAADGMQRRGAFGFV